MIPDHEYRVTLNPNDTDNQIWRRGDNASLAVGQGDVLVTPLQLANAYATFANGGTLYSPRLADGVTPEQRGPPAGRARRRRLAARRPGKLRTHRAHARGARSRR